MKKLLLFIVVAFSLNTNAQIITTIVGNGTQGYSGDGGQATAAELYISTGVVFDASGNLYASDMGNNVVRKVTTSGIIITIAGNGYGAGGSSNGGYSGDGGPATAAELNMPTALALDAFGNLYIPDKGNNVIRKVNTAGIITTVAGNGTGSYGGDGGAATAAQLFYPIAVAVDAIGNLYIADMFNNRIRKVNTAGIISTFAGNGTGGYSGDGGQATAAQLYTPNGIAFDASGNLYVADNDNHCVRKINTSGIITTVAGNGTSGYSGDLGAATAAQLDNPQGLTLDAAGNLYIADSDNQVVRQVNTSGIISTFAGCSSPASLGDGGPATAARLYYPGQLVSDALGNLYIADGNNNRVRKVTPAVTDIKNHTDSDERVVIYPNPAQNNFTVEVSTNEKQTLQLFDVNGKLVLSQNIIDKTTIDVSNLNAGVYSLNLTNSQAVLTKKLVIVK